MHILMLTSEFHPIVGGTEKQAERLSEQLVKKGHKVTIITKWHEGLNVKESYKGIKIKRIKVSNINRLIPYLYLLKVIYFLIRNHKDIDVIHAHTISAPGLSAAVSSIIFKIPTIVKIPGGNKEGSQIKRLFKTKLGKVKFGLLKAHINKFIAISKAIESDLYRLDIPDEKIVPLPNGIDLEMYKPKSNINVNNKNIIYVGRLEHVKGIDFLLESWLRLDNNFKKGKTLTVLGEGSVKIKQDDTISYLGKVNNVIDYLNAAEYYILPSRYEGISNSLLEALANGKVVIASNVGGNPDIIVNEENGLLFKSEDFDSLKQVLDKVFSLSNVEKNRIKLNALKTIEKEYDLEIISEKYLSLYKQLLN